MIILSVIPKIPTAIMGMRIGENALKKNDIFPKID
jgi:hypothetical protein